jgi:histidyl-tRNA synthetase
VCHSRQALAHHLGTRQIDLQDLITAPSAANEHDLARPQVEPGRDAAFDGRVRLTLDRSRPHPHAETTVRQPLGPLLAGARMRTYDQPYHVASPMAATAYQAPRGTQDILPEDAPYWEYVEAEARRQAELANYGEIRTPTFEETAVFLRGVGATTDIVEKEMYTVLSKSGGERATLRPEGTAGVVRAYIQHGMSSRPQPVKLFSLLNCFRYDKPQKGRYREFHQFNIEAIGEADAAVDAELVALQWRLYASLGLRDLSLHLNSIGDANCRPAYVELLRAYFEQHLDGLCEECRRRLQTNPLRLLDEKNPACQAVLAHAPRSADHLCAECLAHFEQLQAYLRAVDVPFTVDARLVRGLDYYTRSVWEVLPPVQGAQSTLGGGGRYDGLAELLGGRPTPGVGFATGIERIILELKQQQAPVPTRQGPYVFISYGASEKSVAVRLADQLRQQGVSADLAFGDRKLGKQLSAADRSGAKYAVILGENELASGTVTLKDLRNGGEQRSIPQRALIEELGHAATE